MAQKCARQLRHSTQFEPEGGAQNHSAGTAYSGPRWGEVRFHSQGQWILTLTPLKPRFWSTFVQYSLNVLAFLLISDTEIKLTDRYRRIASPVPSRPLATPSRKCVQTQCVFNIFNARRSESLHRHRGTRLMQRLGALVRQRPRPSPARPRPLWKPPCRVTVGLF